MNPPLKIKRAVCLTKLLLLTIALSAQSAAAVTAADALSQKGRQAREQGNLVAALDFHRQALAARKLIFSTPSRYSRDASSVPIANSLTNIAHVFYDGQKWDSAAIYYAQAIDYQLNINDLPTEQKRFVGDAYRCWSECLLQMGSFHAARSRAESAVVWLSAADAEWQSAAFNALAQSYRYLGDGVGALAYFQKSLSLLSAQSLNRAAVLTNIAHCYLDRNSDSAFYFFKKALSLTSDTEGGEKSKLLSSLGTYFYKKRDFDKAISYFKQSLQQANTPNLQALAYVNLAKIWREKGEMQQSLMATKTALTLLKAAEKKGGKNYFENILTLTEQAKTLFEIAYAYPKERDWRTAEQAFANAIEYGESYENQIIQPESALLLRGLFYDRYGGAAEVCAQLAVFDTIFMEKSLVYAERGKAFLLKKSKNTPPQYLLKKIQSTLHSADHVLLEYCFGLKQLVVFKISKQDFNLILLPTDSIDIQTQQLYKTLSTPFADNPQPNFSAEAHWLYNRLIKNAELKPQQKLTIVADGILHYIPFEILLTEKPNSVNWQHFPYFLRQNAISYRVAADLPTLAKSKKQKGILAIAPHFEQHPIDLPTLKFNEKESESVISTWKNSQILRGASATSNAFQRMAGNYSILHLSTHGVANDIYPERSFLAFSPIANAVDSSILTAAQIERLDLHAELVTLSACQSARGAFFGGEGLMSLAHSFQSAGCPSVVASLWDVNEERTLNLTTLFYENLKKGLPKDAALQQAKLTMIQNSDDPMLAHPYYWSAFILNGDTEGVDLGFSFSFWWLIAGFGLVLLVKKIFFSHR